MSTVVEIKETLRKLPFQDARAVAAWLEEYLEQQWDRQIEADIAAGKLDRLAAMAMEHYRAGRVKPLDEVLDHP